jgi:hypothetical protein
MPERGEQALCHCLDCRKITGSLFSTNIIVPGESFSVTQGTPKEYSKTADSGKTMTSFFCGDCGSTLWRSSETYGTSKIIKAGTLDGDDALGSTAKPAVELFSKHRIPWLPAIEGTQLNETA